MVLWSYYDKFKDVTDKYLPSRGEGDTMATQIVTAVNKLVYKWYNDGDVYDNRYCLEGWCNDLSSYANWLSKYVDAVELDEIKEIMTNGAYENILKKLADKYLDAEYLTVMAKKPKVGSIYKCEGQFKFEEYEEDEEEYDEEEDEE